MSNPKPDRSAAAAKRDRRRLRNLPVSRITASFATGRRTRPGPLLPSEVEGPRHLVCHLPLEPTLSRTSAAAERGSPARLRFAARKTPLTSGVSHFRAQNGPARALVCARRAQSPFGGEGNNTVMVRDSRQERLSPTPFLEVVRLLAKKIDRFLQSSFGGGLVADRH